MCPDISKCWGKDCPIKEKCYRYTCEPDELQAYSDFTYKLKREVVKSSEGFELIKNSCNYFMPIFESKL